MPAAHQVLLRSWRMGPRLEGLIAERYLVLDMPEQVGRTIVEALIERLRPCELLLVLDNCEHVIDGCAPLVLTLLQNCPALRILATSCEALNIVGEIAWLVPPLSMLDPERTANAAALQSSEAARLFLDRAAAAR